MTEGKIDCNTGIDTDKEVAIGVIRDVGETDETGGTDDTFTARDVGTETDEEDEELDDAPKTAVLTFGLWQNPA